MTHPSAFFVQSPPKGVTIPYRPKPSGSPVIFAGGQVHTTLQSETGSHMFVLDASLAFHCCGFVLFVPQDCRVVIIAGECVL